MWEMIWKGTTSNPWARGCCSLPRCLHPIGSSLIKCWEKKNNMATCIWEPSLAVCTGNVLHKTGQAWLLDGIYRKQRTVHQILLTPLWNWDPGIWSRHYSAGQFLLQWQAIGYIHYISSFIKINSQLNVCLLKCPDRPWDYCVISSTHCEQTDPRETAVYRHHLTFNGEFKADMAEGHGPRVCLQLAHTADVVIVQVNVHKLLLFIHSAYRTEGRGGHLYSCGTKTRQHWQTTDIVAVLYIILVGEYDTFLEYSYWSLKTQCVNNQYIQF